MAGGDGVTSAVVGLVIDPETVVSPFDAGLATTELPNTWAASPISVHSTTTPSVLFMGMAKHSVPVEQTVVITKLPAELQFPTFPAMQAISPDVHGEEKLSVEKRLLYPSASARLELNWAGEIELAVAREVGMVVGICVMDAAETEVVTELEYAGEDVNVLLIREDTSIEMTVVGSGA